MTEADAHLSQYPMVVFFIGEPGRTQKHLCRKWPLAVTRGGSVHVEAAWSVCECFVLVPKNVADTSRHQIHTSWSEKSGAA